MPCRVFPFLGNIAVTQQSSTVYEEFFLWEVLNFLKGKHSLNIDENKPKNTSYSLTLFQSTSGVEAKI